MDWIALPDAAVRQSIDSATVFAEFQRVQGEARSVAGGMYFKRQGPYEYLVRTSPDNRQQRIGPRTAETEDIHARFIARKSRIEARHKSLRDAVREAERLNKALKVGRVPAIVVALLQALHEAGLAEHFRVVGTHALYAYESAAGVRITPGALATQDVDLLWDARRRVRFLADMARLDSSLLDVLRRTDRSFERKEDQLEGAGRAGGDRDVPWIYLDAVPVPVVGGDALAQRGRAERARVPRGFQRAGCGSGARFARAQRDHIVPRGPAPRDFVGNLHDLERGYRRTLRRGHENGTAVLHHGTTVPETAGGSTCAATAR